MLKPAVKYQRIADDQGHAARQPLSQARVRVPIFPIEPPEGARLLRRFAQALAADGGKPA